MEDETLRVPILKFVVLKSERNSYIKEDNDRGKEVKEISKNLVKNMTNEAQNEKNAKLSRQFGLLKVNKISLS